MGKPKKGKVPQVSNQQRITSFFTAATAAPSQPAKRPAQHNVGVSPTAKRDCSSPTPGKENELQSCKKSLSDDFGLNTPWQSPTPLKTNGSMGNGGTGSGASLARNPSSVSNRNGSQGPRSVLSSLSKSVARGNVPVKCPAVKATTKETVFLSDSDDVGEEEEFSVSDSSCDKLNTLPRLNQGKDNVNTLSESQTSHEDTGPRKPKEKDKDKQSISPSNSSDLGSVSEFGKLSNGKEKEEEEEVAMMSDGSEDLFSTPHQTKPEDHKVICDRVAVWKAALKHEYVIGSNDDEVTCGIDNITPQLITSHITPEGHEGIVRASQGTKLKEKLNTTTEITKSLQKSGNRDNDTGASNATTDIKSSQESRTSENNAFNTTTDIKNSQESRTRENNAFNTTTDIKSSQESSTSENDAFNTTTDMKSSQESRTSENDAFNTTTDMKSSQESSTSENDAFNTTTDMKSSQESRTSENDAFNTTTDMKSSQDSSMSEDLSSDILQASQGFGMKRNITDTKEAKTCISNSQHHKLPGNDTADTMKGSSEVVLREVEDVEDVEDIKCCSTSGNTKVKMEGKFDEGPGCLSVDGKSSGDKTPRKLSADEENDCLDILEMFGEMSPFKEKTDTKPSHGLLSDQTVKKFLDEGKNKESYVSQGGFGRHLVVVAERDTSTRTIHLELLSPENVKRTCTLAGTWSDTVVRDGDIIHILLTNPVDGHYHIDNNQGLVVVHPDLLVSSTSVAAGVFCRRRAVLAEWHRGMEPPSVIMTVGSLVHELFQEAVVEASQGGAGQLSEGRLQAMVDGLLGRPKVLEDLYRLDQTVDALRQDVAGFIPKVLAWCGRYLGQGGPGQGGASYKWQGRITHVEEVEENIWCPRLGLKGKVDLVVQVEGGGGGGGGLATLPLELKTGRASFSPEHCGQLALYAMMGTDRRPDPGAGLLLYLREAAMEKKVAQAKERRDLLCLRNDLATHLAARPQPAQAAGEEPGLPPLPHPIAHERGCQQCPHKVTCAAHQVLRGEVPAAPHPMADLVPQHTAHLSLEHLDYFRHWCLLHQLEAAQKVGGGGALWCRNAARREEEGECLAWLVLATTPPTEVHRGCFLHTLVRGRRHPGSAIPLASVGLQVGSLVIASSSTVLALACGTVKGFKDGAVLVELDRPLQGGMAHHYHLDLNSSTNFLRLPMQTLGKLLLPEPRAEVLRRLVVDRGAPAFKKRVPSRVLECKPLLAHLNTAQKRAVIRALAAEDYMLVQGFPGTGKSTMLATMVRVLLQLGRSVLITAYTNTALDSLLLKLHKLGIDFMRVGRSDRVHPDLASHTDQAQTSRVTSVEQLTELYASQRVVAATCLGLGHCIFSRRTFDVCIVDEAAQVQQVAALGPLFLCSAFVLVGDDKQLPPVVSSESAALHGMAETLFERLCRPAVTVTLTEQYRMNGPIMTLANLLTYNNQLTCATPQLEQATLDLPHYQRLVGEGAVAPWLQRVVAPTLEGAVVLVDTAGATEEARVSGSTLANHREARLVIEVARTLLKAGLGASDIGIIAPYRGQVRLVKKLLVEEVEEEDVEKVEVNTVDQYQGRDKMAIICSFVRCGKSSDKPAGILTDCRRLNVALTRAKRKLILIGDQATLTRYSSFSSLMKVLAPHQVYCLAQGTDGFQWQEEEEKCLGVELMEGKSCVKVLSL